MFDEPPGSYDKCNISFCEDDLSQLRFPKTGGANHVSLIEAQKNFAEFGACEKRILKFVRPVSAADVRETEWRPIDINRDNIEEPVSGVDFGTTYPSDCTLLYFIGGQLTGGKKSKY